MSINSDELSTLGTGYGTKPLVQHEKPSVSEEVVDEPFEFIKQGDTEPKQPLRKAKTIAKGGLSEWEKALQAKLDGAWPRGRSYNIASRIGRFFMGILHRIFGRRGPGRQGREDALKLKLPQKTKGPLLAEKWPEGRTAYSAKTLGKAMGLKGKISIKLFEGCIYPTGRPRLADIRQNGGIEDSWFLAAIGAALKSMGSEAIAGLIRKNENGGYDVRLDDGAYTVPSGTIVGENGQKGVSDSAPWVRILEMAMQARLARRASGYGCLQSDIRLDKGELSDGLCALTGAKSIDRPLFIRENFNEVREALKKGDLVCYEPVQGGMQQQLAGVFRDGIRPGHAVTVLAINDSGEMTVFDPYGKVRMLDAGALDRGDIAIVPSPLENKEAEESLDEIERNEDEDEDEFKKLPDLMVRDLQSREEELKKLTRERNDLQEIQHELDRLLQEELSQNDNPWENEPKPMGKDDKDGSQG